MNEKIRQLADEARAWVNDPDNVAPVTAYIFYKDMYDKKFAELIVRECADLCNKFGDRLEDERPNKDLDIVAYECADGLKRHFGVE